MPIAKCINCGHTVSKDAKHCASCEMLIGRVCKCRICMGNGQISPMEGAKKYARIVSVPGMSHCPINPVLGGGPSAKSTPGIYNRAT